MHTFYKQIQEARHLLKLKSDPVEIRPTASLFLDITASQWTWLGGGNGNQLMFKTPILFSL